MRMGAVMPLGLEVSAISPRAALMIATPRMALASAHKATLCSNVNATHSILEHRAKA